MAAGKVAKRSVEVAKKQSTSSSCESDYVKLSATWNPSNLVPVRKLMVWTKQSTKADDNIKVRFSIQNNVYVGQKFAWKVCIDDNHYKVSPRAGILHPSRPQIITVTCAAGLVDRISKDWLEIVFRTTQFDQVNNWDEYWKEEIKSPKTDGLIVGLKFVSDLTGQIFFETAQAHPTGQPPPHVTTTMRQTKLQPTKNSVMRLKKGMLRNELFSSEESYSNKNNQLYQPTNHRTKRTTECEPEERQPTKQSMERQPTKQSMERQPTQEKDHHRKPFFTKLNNKRSRAVKSASSKASIEPEKTFIDTAAAVEEEASSSSSLPSVIVRTKIPEKRILDKQTTMNKNNTKEKLKISEPKVKVADNRSAFLKTRSESSSDQDDYSVIKSEEEPEMPKTYHTDRKAKDAHIKAIYSGSSSEKKTPLGRKTSIIKPEEELGAKYNQSNQAMKKSNKKRTNIKKKPDPVKPHVNRHRSNEAEEEYEQVPLKANYSNSNPSKPRPKFRQKIPVVVPTKSPHAPITSETATMQGQSTMINVQSRMNTSSSYHAMVEPKGLSPYIITPPAKDRRKSAAADRPPYFEPWEESHNYTANKNLEESPREEFPTKTRRRRKQEQIDPNTDQLPPANDLSLYTVVTRKKSEDVQINYSKRGSRFREDVEPIGNAYVEAENDPSILECRPVERQPTQESMERQPTQQSMERQPTQHMNTTSSNPSTKKTSKIFFWRKKPEKNSSRSKKPPQPRVVERQGKPTAASSVESFSSIEYMEEPQFKATKNQPVKPHVVESQVKATVASPREFRKEPQFKVRKKQRNRRKRYRSAERGLEEFPNKTNYSRSKNPPQPHVGESQVKPRFASSVDSFSSIESLEETQYKTTKIQQNRRKRSAERSLEEFPNKINYSRSNQSLNRTTKKHHSQDKAGILKHQAVYLNPRQSKSISSEERPPSHKYNYKTKKAQGPRQENYIKAETKKKQYLNPRQSESISAEEGPPSHKYNYKTEKAQGAGRENYIKAETKKKQYLNPRLSESISDEEGPPSHNYNYKTEKAQGAGRENYIKAETKNKAAPSAVKSSNQVPVIVTNELVIKETPYKRHKSPPKITKNQPKEYVPYSNRELEKRLKGRNEPKLQPKAIKTPVKKEPTRTPTSQFSNQPTNQQTKQTYRKTRYSKSSSDEDDYESTEAPTKHMKY